MALIDPQFAFGLAGQLMLPLWLLMIVSLWVKRLWPIADWVAFFGLPLLLGAVYVAYLVQGLPFEEGGFGSLEQVRVLFATDSNLLAGWVHYLVFDYFVAGWVARQRRQEPVPALLALPCVVLCFLAGPAGLLAWLLLRSAGRGLARRREAAA